MGDTPYAAQLYNLLSTLRMRSWSAYLLCLFFDTQKDELRKNKNFGYVKQAIDKFKGNPMFGLVTLCKNERSEFSSLADLLLE
jgi:predicted ribonuclease YlaK